MKKTLCLLTLLVACAVPAFAQSSEFGFLVGASRRMLEDTDPAASDATLANDELSLSNQAIDVYYGIELDPGTMFKLRAGQIDTPTAVREREGDADVRRDFDGEMQHVEGVVEYDFSEPFGSTGVFAGVGLFRQQIEDRDTETSYGLLAGLNADFPLSRRYGVIVEATYYWTRFVYRPRYLTLSGGLRIAF